MSVSFPVFSLSPVLVPSSIPCALLTKNKFIRMRDCYRSKLERHKGQNDSCPGIRATWVSNYKLFQQK